MFSFTDVKDVVSELALHADSKVLVFMSELLIFLSDDHSARSASFSSTEFFLKFYWKWAFLF